MELAHLGFRASHADALAALARPSLTPARVLRAAADLAWTRGVDGARTVRVPKSLHRTRDHRGESLWPVSGDWVAVDPAGTVVAVLPRFTRFVRKAAGTRDAPQLVAANLDRVLLLMGLDQDFNLRRLERYLALAAQSEAEPVVVLTKASLCPEREARVAEARAAARGVAVLPVDVVSGYETLALQGICAPGSTLALVGSSGVGKSTLVNFLMGEDVSATGAVRARDDRGKHTTTRRELFWTPGHTALVDTPGMRELGLWGDDRDVDGVFDDIAAVATGCRFRDCAHEREPGCAVVEALGAGALDEARVRAWKALRDELASRSRRR
jgi:ribosome biogenesis GTPase